MYQSLKLIILYKPAYNSGIYFFTFKEKYKNATNSYYI